MVSRAVQRSVVIGIFIDFPTILGPCVLARRTNTQLRCSDDGYYKPLQCRRRSNTTFECICVRRDGTAIQRTATVVDSRDDAPDCEDIGTHMAVTKYSVSIYTKL